jgi:uncharacterized membrane protein (DUF485 family)
VEAPVNPDTHLADITRVIQLAIAPVFLLTSIGTIINVLSTRLGRIVDRTRTLEDKPLTSDDDDEARAERDQESITLDRRMHLVYVAIALAVVGAVCVGLLIATAFADALLAVDLARGVATLFVMAIGAILAALLVYLRELVLAIGAARERTERRRRARSAAQKARKP